MYEDELSPDPFERRHVGEHGAFLIRTNPEHIERCRARIELRRITEVQVNFSRTDKEA